MLSREKVNESATSVGFERILVPFNHLIKLANEAAEKAAAKAAAAEAKKSAEAREKEKLEQDRRLKEAAVKAPPSRTLPRG